MSDPAVSDWVERIGRHTTAGDAAGALACATEAVAALPEAASLQTLYGVALAMSGRLDEAAEAMERAAKLAPSDPEPLRNAVGLYLRLADFDRARDAAGRHLALAARNAEAHRLLGAATAGAGAMETAAARFRVAVTLDPRHVQAWLDLSAALFTAGRLEDAIAAIDAALEANPGEALLIQRRLALVMRQVAKAAD